MSDRIASLLPAATEIVAALGLGDRVVARSHACDHPPWVSAVPAVTGSAVDSSAESAEIDAQVRERVRAAASLFDLDAAALVGVRPDLVLTQDRCAACAVPFSQVEADLAALADGARLLSLAPARLADVWDDVRRVAAAAGVTDRGDTLAATLAGRVERVRARTADRARPAVAALEWLDPPMAAGHWVPELIDAAGGRDVLGTPGAAAYFVDWADVAAADPDVIVAMPCGFDRARTQRELARLDRDSAWASLRAVHAGRVHAADANALFSRPGPRLADSAEWLASVLHPRGRVGPGAA